jgi:hypothetical protein
MTGWWAPEMRLTDFELTNSLDAFREEDGKQHRSRRIKYNYYQIYARRQPFASL